MNAVVTGLLRGKRLRPLKARYGSGHTTTVRVVSVEQLSASEVAPVCRVRRLMKEVSELPPNGWSCGTGHTAVAGDEQSLDGVRKECRQEGEGHTGLNALPDVYTPTFSIPSATLRVQGPVDVDIPDFGGI